MVGVLVRESIGLSLSTFYPFFAEHLFRNTLRCKKSLGAASSEQSCEQNTAAQISPVPSRSDTHAQTCKKRGRDREREREREVERERESERERARLNSPPACP